MIVTAGSTGRHVYFYIQEDAGATNPGEPVTALTSTDLDSASYARSGAARVGITLSSTLASASAGWTSGGFILVDNTNMAGTYRLDVPDAAFATGVDQVIVQVDPGAARVCVPVNVDVTDLDLRDSVRGGLTALPNAAADAAGGLPISDLGGLDLDTQLAATNEVTAARMGALTDWIDGGRLDVLLDAIPTTAMRGTDNAALASVLGALADAASSGDIDTSTTAISYLKQLLNELSGSVGIGTMPTLLDPANGINLFEMLRAAMGGTFASATDSLEQLQADHVTAQADLDIITDSDGVIIGAAGIDLVWDEVLTGGTHNVVNSAGRRLRQIQEAGGYSGGFVYLDTVGGSSGTTDFENGVDSKATDSIADANTIATSIGLSKYDIAPNSTVGFTATQDGQVFRGSLWTLALGSQQVNETHIVGAEVSGICTGHVHMDHCHLGVCSFAEGEFSNCGLDDTFTITGANSFIFTDCYHEEDGAPSTLDFGSAVGATEVHIHGWKGNLLVRNMDTSDILHFTSAEGTLTLDSSNTAGTANLAGSFGFTDNSSTVTINDNGLVYDRLGTPAGASMSVDIAAIEAQTDDIGVAGAGLTAIPVTVDWANGGRLDVILDIIAADVVNIDGAAMRGTDSAALASVLGALNDSANTGDIDTSTTLMAYGKQLLNEISGTVGIGTMPSGLDPANGINLFEMLRAAMGDTFATATDALDELQADNVALQTGVDAIPTTAMRGTDNAALASVLGALADAAASGDIDTSTTIMSYLKQQLNEFSGSVGIGTMPTGLDPANGINLFEMLRAAMGATFATATDSLEQLQADHVAIQADTDDIQTRLPTALVSGAMDSDVSAMQSDVVTAAALATDAVNEIRDAMLPTQNAAFNFKFTFVATSDGRTPVTGASGTAVTRSLDGGAYGSATGTLSEIANGTYRFAASAADMNGGDITFRFTGTGGTPGAPDDTFVHIITTGGV